METGLLFALSPNDFLTTCLMVLIVNFGHHPTLPDEGIIRQE